MAYVSALIYIPEAAKSLNVELLFPTDGLLVEGREEVKGVITLLHGLFGSGKDWLSMTAASRYAYDRGYILICPSCDNSFYCDMDYGPPYYSTILNYLPRQLELIFKIPREREKNYIAGLSMGGYGAMKIGLLNPDKYAAIGAFSGALDAAELMKYATGPARRLVTPVFGEDLSVGEDEDLFKIVKAAAPRQKEYGQRILITCGMQDDEDAQARIYSQNRKFRAAAAEAGLDFSYREWEGSHVWHVWDRSLAEFIAFIEGSGYDEETKNHWK